LAVRAAESGTRDHRRKFVRVLRALEDKYGRHIYPEERTLLEQAIFALLAYDNPVTNARKALRDLKDDFVDWNECRCATPREIEAILERSRIEPRDHLAESIIELLQRAFQEFCQADLECLRTDPPERTRRFLQKLEAAETGRKHRRHRVFSPWEVQYVELAAGLEPAPPVDPATDRVCVRLGVLPPASAHDPEKRRKALELLAPTADEAVRLHHLLAEHGKKVCHESDMKCAKCIIQEDCDWFRAERARKKAAPAAAAKAAAGVGSARKAAKGARAPGASRDGKAAAAQAKTSGRKAAAGSRGAARAAKSSRRRSDDEE